GPLRNEALVFNHREKSYLLSTHYDPWRSGIQVAGWRSLGVAVASVIDQCGRSLRHMTASQTSVNDYVIDSYIDLHPDSTGTNARLCLVAALDFAAGNANLLGGLSDACAS
ncbi:MAG: hypothetical protein OXP69_18840, partial [Spirochaetaceae bacterium]|nr:hypothetical protein [Spirochaetaceae bacterium]